MQHLCRGSSTDVSSVTTTRYVAESGIVLRARAELEVPDLQLLFGPTYCVNHGLETRTEHCFGFAPTLVTPESRGEITVRSADSFAPPAIRASYLSPEHDLRVIIEGVRVRR
jgi:choline dehydrogenase